ncbi:hypothetical protein M378DRAFT_178438 [Amanita muscaria Koide BX008]|uniref:Uncharacterized protein n=1 Tax=Amanita muscaria (strain Koide BX008) TaxID=946122 RepID=A0A0C2TEL1_AMAMK|nr:hypothetical protein M378DRAFT_178438 [Amanita muscaria Koide BX008]
MQSTRFIESEWIGQGKVCNVAEILEHVSDEKAKLLSIRFRSPHRVIPPIIPDTQAAWALHNSLNSYQSRLDIDITVSANNIPQTTRIPLKELSTAVLKLEEDIGPTLTFRDRPEAGTSPQYSATFTDLNKRI